MYFTLLVFSQLPTFVTFKLNISTKANDLDIHAANCSSYLDTIVKKVSPFSFYLLFNYPCKAVYSNILQILQSDVKA